MITNPNVVAVNVHVNPTSTYRVIQVPNYGTCAGFTSLGIDGVDVYFNDDNGGVELLDQLIETATAARDGMAERMVLAGMLEAGNDGGVPDAELEGGDGTCPNTGRSATVCDDPTHTNCPQLAPANDWQ